MLVVSDAYKGLVKSNIRPKCEPVIKVHGKDNTGKEVELTWNAKNIKDLKYTRGIDPVGRELPYIELVWTEIYTGRLNSENYAEKYNNVIKYMQVELSFVQDLSFYNTWEVVFNSGTRWNELFSKNYTWKRLKAEPSKETITMPKLFLSARPTISGQTITWTAKDCLSFIEEETVYMFDGKSYSAVSPKEYINPIIYLLINSRSAFIGSKELFNSVSKSIEELKKTNYGYFNELVIFKGKVKNSIMQYLNLKNLHINFKEDFFLTSDFSPTSTKAEIKRNVMLKYPDITKTSNISEYSFSYNFYDYVNTTMYDLPPTTHTRLSDSATLYVYIFKDLGALYSEDLGEYYLADAVEYSTVQPPNYSVVEKVSPINEKSINSKLQNHVDGETYSENNPMNIYNENSDETKVRFDFLKKYFNDSCSSLSFQCLADLSIEAGDVISVETNLYDNGQNVTKKAVVVKTELNYNGSMKETFTCHEVLL